MHKWGALLRASWLAGWSYRVEMLISIVSLVVSVVPVYFIARALQPMMANSIREQGGEYFGFVLVGMAAFTFLSVAVNALPRIIGSAIGSGTLEAYFVTPTRLPTLLGGLMSYDFLWTLARAILLLGTGAMFGANLAWRHMPAAIAVLVLIVLSYLPFGILGAALLLWFRTTGPLPKAVITASGFLGGVYYPTHVIPSWLHAVSTALPLTYGLRALRRIVLEGAPVSAVATDLGILVVLTLALGVLSVGIFARALRGARQSGSLGQY